jgi:hypothetical protein
LEEQRISVVAAVISVDLALRRWADIGIAILTNDGQRIRVQFVELGDSGTLGPQDPQTLATKLAHLIKVNSASVLLIDGPQAWKDPDNGIAHMRLCERELHTPAKCGLPGQVKPATWTPFVTFSIDLFAELETVGLIRLTEREPVVPTGNVLLLEVFPTAAWRGLGIACLPGKARAKREDIGWRMEALVARYSLDVDREPTHDQLQAMVSGLAGVAITRGCPGNYSVHGVPPRRVGGHWREGFIVNPKTIQKTVTP